MSQQRRNDKRKQPKQHYTPPEDGSAPSPDETERLVARGKNYCYWWLGQADRAESFLRGKLAGKGYPEDIIDSILEALREDGYVDDESFAHRYVRNRQEMDKRGTQAIRFELSRKGIDRDTIEAALEEEVDEEVQRSQALELARQKARGSRGVDKQKRVQRIVGALARRGYSMSMAFELARTVLQEEDEETHEDFE